jgi:hypothetical protein
VSFSTATPVFNTYGNSHNSEVFSPRRVPLKKMAYLLLILNLMSLLGCSTHVSSEKVSGMYLATYPFGKAVLVLQTGGTFVQTVEMNGESAVARGSWNFDSQNSKITLLGIMPIVDGFGHLERNWRKHRRSQWTTGRAALAQNRNWDKRIVRLCKAMNVRNDGWRNSAPWKALDFSGCNSRPGTGSLHPVAIEAAAEATKLSELSMERVAWRLGERAGHNVSERWAGPEKTIAGADLTVTQGRPLAMESDERIAPLNLPG